MCANDCVSVKSSICIILFPFISTGLIYPLIYFELFLGFDIVPLMIFLISIIGLLNRGYVGEFLTYIMVYIFGVFYFIFFIGLAAFGLTYAIKRKGFSIKVNLYLLGGILLIFSLMIAASISMENLELTNVFTTYNHRISYISSSLFNISDLTKLGYTGGGFIGTFFTALFNTAFTSLGTHIVAIILFTSSIIILMKNPLQRLFSWSKKRKEEKRNRKSLDLEKLNPGSNFFASKYFFVKLYRQTLISGIPNTETTSNKAKIKYKNNIKNPLGFIKNLKPSKKPIFILFFILYFLFYNCNRIITCDILFI